ncbi:MAG: hypothetical protein LBS88_11325 [Tannerellaceae bacterium]|nr:hypothetical protein [Tannerellaceae bacterium]
MKLSRQRWSTDGVKNMLRLRVQFKLSQIQWISIVIARNEAIQGVPGLDCFTLPGSQ